jgi:hypothetical protein
MSVMPESFEHRAQALKPLALRIFAELSVLPVLPVLLAPPLPSGPVVPAGSLMLGRRVEEVPPIVVVPPP